MLVHITLAQFSLHLAEEKKWLVASTRGIKHVTSLLAKLQVSHFIKFFSFDFDISRSLSPSVSRDNFPCTLRNSLLLDFNTVVITRPCSAIIFPAPCEIHQKRCVIILSFRYRLSWRGSVRVLLLISRRTLVGFNVPAKQQDSIAISGRKWSWIRACNVCNWWRRDSKRFIDTVDPPVATNKAIIYQDSPLHAHRVPLSRTITRPDIYINGWYGWIRLIILFLFTFSKT